MQRVIRMANANWKLEFWMIRWGAIMNSKVWFSFVGNETYL
jgi:hypothetical protein